MEDKDGFVSYAEDLKYANTTDIRRNVKNATGKEYVFMEDKDGFVSYAEDLKYANTTDIRRTVQSVTQHKRHNKNTRLSNTSQCYITKFTLTSIHSTLP